MTTFRQHLSATAWISAPVALALLSEMAMGLTDTVMLGGIGGAALAAGGLGANIFLTGLIVLQGVLSGVSVFAARALGAGRDREVPAIYWSGVALAVLLGAVLFALISAPQRLLALAGEPPKLAADLSAYLHVLRWGVPGGMVGVGMMRQFLPAVGLQRVLLWVVPAAVGVNAGLNWVLIHGVRWGWVTIAGRGLLGSAAATAITITLLGACLLMVLHGRRRWRRFVAPAWPQLRLVGAMLALGLPVGLMVTVEAALFLATGLLAGGLGQDVLAAHMIAISVCSVSFMVPLSIAQTANVRVAHASGAGQQEEARRAGFAAIVLAVCFMMTMAVLLTQAPGLIVGVYLSGSDPGRAGAGDAAVVALAASLLRVAGVFQIVDGAQVAAAGALRGLRDTRVPLILAAAGYWGIGFWLGRYLAFDRGLGAAGLWWGISAGLAVVAASLVSRFALRTDVLARPLSLAES